MSVRETIIELATEYVDGIPELTGQVPPTLLTDFVIEKYKQQRNYPAYFTDDDIETDMENHKTTIAMAVMDLYCKVGMEGELSHTELGVTRMYENAYISKSIFNDVLPYVKSI